MRFTIVPLEDCLELHVYAPHRPAPHSVMQGLTDEIWIIHWAENIAFRWSWHCQCQHSVCLCWTCNNLYDVCISASASNKWTAVSVGNTGLAHNHFQIEEIEVQQRSSIVSWCFMGEGCPQKGTWGTSKRTWSGPEGPKNVSFCDEFWGSASTRLRVFDPRSGGAWWSGWWERITYRAAGSCSMHLRSGRTKANCNW